MKKIIALILCMLMLVSVVPLSVAAADTSEQPTSNPEINCTIGGTNDLGALISNSLEEECDDDITNKILSVTVSEKIAYVEFNNDCEAVVIVGIFDEDGKNMICSGMTNVAEKACGAYVNIQTDTMPEYFIVRAFLLDSEYSPLDKSFESVEYTRAHQEFLAATVDDFDQDKVVNFDESDDNNFAVFDEETVLVDQSEKNILVSENADKSYTFSNIDEKISSLTVGDIFYYTYGTEEDYIIIKVKKIEINGTKAKIYYDEDIKLDEVFSYVKIDTTGDYDAVEVDTSNADEGVEYLGDEDIQQGFWDEDISVSKTLSFSFSRKFLDEDEMEASLSFGLRYTLDAKLKAYVYIGYAEVSFEINNAATAFVEFTGQYSPEPITLADVDIPTPIAGVDFNIELKFVTEYSATAAFEVSVTSTVAFSYDTESNKIKNKSKPVEVDASISIEGKFFVGLQLEVGIKIIKIIKIAGTGQLGGEIVGKLDGVANYLFNEDEKHLCVSCIDGEINRVFEVGVVFEVEISKIWSFSKEYTALAITDKILDFYYQIDTGRLGFGECPNHEYKVTVAVVSKKQFNDNRTSPVANAFVDGQISDKTGVVEKFYKAGLHKITISGDRHVSKTYKLNVPENDSYVVELDKKPDQNYITDTISYKLQNGVLVVTGKGAIPDYGYGEDPEWLSNRYAIRKVIIGEGITSTGQHGFRNLPNLTEIVLPSTLESFGGFYNAKSVSSIKLPFGLKTIKNSAFSGWTSLEYLSIPETVTTIGAGVFSGSGLKSIKIPSLVKEMGSLTFEGCKNLVSVSLPESLTSIPHKGFNNCVNLKNINIPSRTTLIDDYAFQNCQSLTGIRIPNTVRQIGYCAFWGCSSLKSIDLPYGISTIETQAFGACKSLTSVSIPSSVTTFEHFVFAQCENLKTAFIPNGIISLYGTFSGCYSLTSVVLPATLRTIDNFTFDDISHPFTIYFTGTSAQWAKVTVKDYNEDLKYATVVFDAGSSTGNEMVMSIGETSEELLYSDVTEEPENDDSGITVTKSNLVPNENYVLLVLRGNDIDYTVDCESLVYIADSVSDDNGDAKFTYYGENNADIITLVFGKCNHITSDWKVSKDPTDNESGLKVKHCTVCEDCVEAKTIAAFPNELKFSDVYFSANKGSVLNVSVNKSDYNTEYYSNIRVETVIGNNKQSAADGIVLDQKTDFAIEQITAKNVLKKVTAKLYATYDGFEFLFDTYETSVYDLCVKEFDANFDGEVDIRDLIRAKKASAGVMVDTEFDPDHNGSIEAEDIVQLRGMLLRVFLFDGVDTYHLTSDAESGIFSFTSIYNDEEKSYNISFDYCLISGSVSCRDDSSYRLIADETTETAVLQKGFNTFSGNFVIDYLANPILYGSEGCDFYVWNIKITDSENNIIPLYVGSSLNMEKISLSEVIKNCK